MGDAAELGSIGLAGGWAWKTGTLKAGLKKVAESLVVDVGIPAIGAVAGGIVFGIEAYDWLTWDTSFVLRSGLGKPPIQPAPTPSP